MGDGGGDLWARDGDRRGELGDRSGAWRRRDGSTSISHLPSAISCGEAAGFSEFRLRGERGAGKDHAAVLAEGRADGVGGVDAGEGELAGTRTPQEFFQARIGEPFAELLGLPELVAELRAERGVVEREVAEELGDLAERVGDIRLERGIEGIHGLKGEEQLRPAFPRADEWGGGVDVVELGQQGGGIVRAGGVRVGIGDARGQVVRLVEDEESAGGVEAGLVVEQRAVARGEDVIVVADPDVVEREGGAGDFVGADARIAAGGAEGLEVARVVFETVELGEPAGGPAFLEAVEVVAGLTHAVEDGIDAVLALVADVPDGDGSRRLGHG